MLLSINHFVASISLPAINDSLLHHCNLLPYFTLYHFVTSRICLSCHNLWRKIIKASMRWREDLFFNLNNLSNPVAPPPKSIVVFAYTCRNRKIVRSCCVKISAYNVDAMNWCSIKRFTASIFHGFYASFCHNFFSAFNASITLFS